MDSKTINEKSKQSGVTEKLMDLIHEVRKIERDISYDEIEVVHDNTDNKVFLKYKPRDIIIFEHDKEDFNNELENVEHDLSKLKRVAWNYYWDVLVPEEKFIE